MRKRVNCRSSIACVVVVRLKDIGESGGLAVVSPTVMLQELRSRETDHCVKRDDFRDYVEASAKVQCTTQHRTSSPCSLTQPLFVCAVVRYIVLCTVFQLVLCVVFQLVLCTVF